MPDSIPITITAKTMEGSGAVDPEVTVEISEVMPTKQITLSRHARPELQHYCNGGDSCPGRVSNLAS